MFFPGRTAGGGGGYTRKQHWNMSPVATLVALSYRLAGLQPRGVEAFDGSRGLLVFGE